MNMYVVIDETADFVEAGKHKFGIVTLVTCSDKAWEQFVVKMDSIFPNWKSTKSKDIKNVDRKKILKEVTLRNEIKYYAYAYDISAEADRWAEWHKVKQAEKIQKAIGYCRSEGSPETLIKDLNLLKTQILAYSTSDYVKFILIFDLLAEWNKFNLFDYIYMDSSRDSWNFSLIVDTQTKSKKFERLIHSMLILTTNERNPDYKTFIPKEWGSDHPYVQKYAIDLSVKNRKSIKTDGRKIYPEIKVTSEQVAQQLFLPDFIGSILHKSIFYQSKMENHKVLARLSSARSLALNNRFIKSKNNYYHIKTFNKSLNSDDVSDLFRNHYKIINR